MEMNGCAFCRQDTLGNHEENCPMNPKNLKSDLTDRIFPNYGWICPVCGRGNAPFVSVCPCKGEIFPKYDVTCKS